MFVLDDIEFSHEPHVIFDGASCGEHHGREPVLRRMPNRDLLCLVYAGGAREPAPENYVLTTRSEDDGQTWSTPEKVFDRPDRACWGTELFVPDARTAIMFVHTFMADTYYREIKAFNLHSQDSGRTWSEPRNVEGFPANVSVRRGIVLTDGTWVFPVYWQPESAGFRCGVIRSTNRGEFYSLHGYLAIDGPLWEPNIAEIDSGHLVMYIRNKNGELYVAESLDAGLNWSAPTPSGVPSPGAKVTLLKHENTTIMLNSSCTDERRVIDLKTSKDGKTWTDKLVVARDRRENPFVCYPDGFADDEKQAFYVAIDSGAPHSRKRFYMLKIPYSEVL